MSILILFGILSLFNTLTSESVFIDPKVRKDVKKYILDERKQNEILDVMKKYKEDYLLRRGIEKEMEAKFEELYSVKGSDMEEFKSVIRVYNRTRTDTQGRYVKAITKFKSLVSDQEWEQLLVNMDKSAKKYLEDQDKIITKYKKTNSEISFGLKGIIEDEESREKAVSIMTEIDEREMSILKKLQTFNNKDWEMLRDRKTTKEAYEQALKEYNDLWQSYFDLYLDAYDRLSKIMTDDEWKIIKKYSKKIF